MKKFLEPELNIFDLQGEVILTVSGGDRGGNANEDGQTGAWGDFWTTP